MLPACPALGTLAVTAKVSIDGVYKKERDSGRGTSLPTHSVRDHQTPHIPAMKLVSGTTPGDGGVTPGTDRRKYTFKHFCGISSYLL